MPLQVIDADLFQAQDQFDGFNRLRDGSFARDSGDFVNRSDHGMIKFAVGEFANETAIDLDQVYRKLLEIIECRQPFTEVIQRDLAAEVAQCGEETACFLQAVYRGRLGDFETQNTGFDVVRLVFVKQKTAYEIAIHRLSRQVDMPGAYARVTSPDRADPLERIADHPPVDRARYVIVLGRLHEYVGRVQFAVGVFESDQKLATPVVIGCR